MEHQRASGIAAAADSSKIQSSSCIKDVDSGTKLGLGRDGEGRKEERAPRFIPFFLHTDPRSAILAVTDRQPTTSMRHLEGRGERSCGGGHNGTCCE